MTRPWFRRHAPSLSTGSSWPAPAWDFHRSMPEYAVTPLTAVPGLARRWGVATVWVKDESHRLGLPAFKVLGASWAVNRAIAAASEQPVPDTWAQLRNLTAGHDFTLVTATDGNHGRALARIARLLGIAARVYVPGGLPSCTVEAIGAEGAVVIDTGRRYDKAVARAAAELTAKDLLIQDTAWEGYEEVPNWIVEGYSTLFTEIDLRLPEPVDTLVVPTGVGTLLQSALRHYKTADGGPRVLAVEPESAACVTAALHSGHVITVDTSASTTMAGLNCGTMSATAWPVVKDSLDAAVAVTETEAAQAGQVLHDTGIDVGPCGAAALAGLEAARTMPGGPATLGLDSTTRVVLLSTEGTRTW